MIWMDDLGWIWIDDLVWIWMGGLGWSWMDGLGWNDGLRWMVWDRDGRWMDLNG